LRRKSNIDASEDCVRAEVRDKNRALILSAIQSSAVSRPSVSLLGSPGLLGLNAARDGIEEASSACSIDATA
jgi:hypothetical protein